MLDRLGLSIARLRQLGPGLVALGMGAFGAAGRWRGFRAYGSTVEQASGIPLGNGHEGDPPAIQHIAFGDPVAGLFGAAAVLVGLAGCERLRGCAVDLAQVETLFQLNADAMVARAVTGAPLPRTGSRRATLAPCVCVATADADGWLAVECGENAWPALCGLLDRVEWQAFTLKERQTHADAIEGALAVWAGTKPMWEATNTLQGAGVPAAPARSIETLTSDAQLVASGFWVQLERAHLGRYHCGAAPFLLDGTRPCAATPAPTLGEHHAAVIGAMKEDARA